MYFYLNRRNGAVAAHHFSRKNPLACWISNLLAMFASQILSNFLLNEPVISCCADTRQVLTASAVWYFIYYSPFDCVYKFTQFMPIKLVLFCLNEIYSIHSTEGGLKHASKVYPNSFAVMLVIGVVRGNGFKLLRLFEGLTRGTCNLSLFEFIRPSYSTKLCIATCVLLIVNDVSFFYALPRPLASALLSLVSIVSPNSTFLNYYSNSNHNLNNFNAHSQHSSNIRSSLGAASEVVQDDEELYVFMSRDLLILCIVIVAIYLRLCVLLLNVGNPFKPVEDLLCMLLFGGIWDAIARAIAIDERKTSHARSATLLQHQAQHKSMEQREQQKSADR